MWSPDPGLICISLDILHDFVQRGGDGVDGEVAPEQIFFDCPAVEGGDIEDDVRWVVFDDDAAGFFMQVGVESAQCVG